MEKTKNPYYKFADYVLMAMIASMGIAVKVIIVPLAHILTGPLFIPGGVVAGGFYMAFLVLGEAITQKHGTATIIALIQAVAVLITGTFRITSYNVCYTKLLRIASPSTRKAI